MNDDLISRQAAIDSIEEHLRCGDELYPLTDTDKVLNHGFEIAASCVYNLPSVQPELIRCKDCKHWGMHKRLNVPWCYEMHIDKSEDGYCDSGERNEE